MEVDQTIFYLYNNTEYQVRLCNNKYNYCIIYNIIADSGNSVKREVVAEIEIGLNGGNFLFREGESEKTLWECEIYYNYYT